MAGANLIVAGTGFEGRERAVRAHCKPGREVLLIRDPGNPHDPNAVGVYVETAFSVAQIGFLKAGAAKTWAKRMDSGMQVTARIDSMYAPEGMDHPRVTLRVETVRPDRVATPSRREPDTSVAAEVARDEPQAETGRPEWERFGIDPATKRAAEEQRKKDIARGAFIWMWIAVFIGVFVYACSR